MRRTGKTCHFCMVGLVAAILALILLPDGEVATPAILRAALVDEKAPLQPFQLVDHHQRPLNPDHFQGQWTFVVFGFTHCPDICPANLAQLAAVKQIVDERFPDLPVPQMLFISVDPRRDTLEHLAAYVRYFDPDLVGATGTQDSVALILLTTTHSGSS